MTFIQIVIIYKTTFIQVIIINEMAFLLIIVICTTGIFYHCSHSSFIRHKLLFCT
jgi:hypothetical protein